MSKKLNDEQLANFCQQMHLVISSGLFAYEGIAILLDDAEDRKTKEFLNRIYIPMKQGSSLYQALDATKSFPPYMIQMMKLGEETGKLDDVLKSLHIYYTKEHTIKETIRYASIYPFCMFLLMMGVLVVLLTKVLPIFSNIYKSLGSDLTGFSRRLMNISTMINNYLVYIILFIFLLLIGLFLLTHTTYGKNKLFSLPIYRSIAISRFSNCMYMTIASGLSQDYGLHLAKELVSNAPLIKKIQLCEEMLENGSTLSKALNETGIFPKLYCAWIDIAHSSGHYEEVFKQISDAYEESSDKNFYRFISYFEPAMVIILSLFVGAILISFLLPLIGIMSSIG